MKKFMRAFLVMLSAVSILAAAVCSSTAFAAEYDSSGATSFIFSDSEITVNEGNYTGYKISGTDLTINADGTYVVSGSCSDGSITVKKGTVGVTLVLNGLILTSSDTSPIACNKSSGVKIVVAAGTTNTLADSSYNNDDIYPDNTNAENAVIKCKDGSQVTICGSGTLNIDSKGKNGIKSGCTTDTEGEAWLEIQDVTLNITAAVNDGINAEQLLSISSGNITVNSADDGIHCDYVLNIGSEGTTGPTINITKSYEGLEAATLNIYSGNITIYSTDDGINAANSDLTDYAFSLNIAGGDVYVYTSAGDGVDSNGTFTVSGGTLQVWTATTSDNQPLDADGDVSITGGTVLAAGGSSGMGLNLSTMQAYVIFGSGTIHNNRPGGPFGGQFGGQTGSSSVNISSGRTITIKDSSGNTIYSGTAVCNVRYLFFSSADLTIGDTYTLYSENTSVATAAAQGNYVDDTTDPTGTTEPTEPTDPTNPTDPTDPQPTDPETYTVSGVVNVSDSDSSTDMTVTAVSSDGTEVSETVKSMSEYSITGLEAGTYKLEISGGKYAPREYIIEISDANVSQDVSLNPYGDITGDGKVTTADVGLANSHAKGVTLLTDYKFVCANVSDKTAGEVTTSDVGMINSHAKGVKALW